MNKTLIDKIHLKCECGSEVPSIDAWLSEAKNSFPNYDCGIFLTHNGVVRSTSKKEVQSGKKDLGKIAGMNLSVDEAKVCKLAEEIKLIDGVNYLRIWINQGNLKTGDSMMFILIGSQTRKQAVFAFNSLMDKLKGECLTEDERFI